MNTFPPTQTLFLRRITHFALEEILMISSSIRISPPTIITELNEEFV
jgi:hypothetical protein